ncbi:MAG: hypothetical protein WC894_05255 [Patescibacteria group bacterium]
MNKIDINSVYTDTLSNITKGCLKDSYIILGSAATLSFTSKVGYSRKINDLDIIADESLVKKMKHKLLKQKFIQSTFINKRMPFFQKLIKHSDSSYLRFSKGGVNVEILSTKFIKNASSLILDLYPNFWVKIPVYSLTQTKLGRAQFTTLDVNLLWAVKQLLNNTLGRFMLYKRKQRVDDLFHLKKIVNIKKAKELLRKSRFGYKSLSFKVPEFFLK